MIVKVTDSKTFGEAIRTRRKELGYTQTYISEFTGLSVSFLSNLENGYRMMYLLDFLLNENALEKA